MSQRTEKVAHLARAVIGDSIRSVKDPRVGFVTITAVRVTPDLRQVRVIVSVLGTEEEQEATMEGLASATPFLRSELGRHVRLRYLPELTFERDEAGERADRIERLLRQIEKEHEERAPAPNEEGT